MVTTFVSETFLMLAIVQSYVFTFLRVPLEPDGQRAYPLEYSFVWQRNHKQLSAFARI